MKSQISFKDKEPTLYLVATPIGNLEDMTVRAINILNEVDLIFAEDTRTSHTLLKRYDIKTPLISYHRHNESMRTQEAVNELINNKNIALISDAGTPLISDPGNTLVDATIKAGFKVVSIPGASAGITALVASNISTTPHLFWGFLPAKNIDRKKTLEQLKLIPYTLIFYEAPHRIHTMLETMLEVFGPRQVTIARELTKRYETYWRGDLKDYLEIGELKGEIVVIVSGFTAQVSFQYEDLIAQIELQIEDGNTEMDAIKSVAKTRKMKKNDVYMAYLTHKQHFKSPKE